MNCDLVYLWIVNCFWPNFQGFISMKIVLIDVASRSSKKQPPCVYICNTVTLAMYYSYGINLVNLWTMTPHSMISSKLIFFSGLKCKECKYRCHRDCESHVPPSCGLPEDLLRHYINQLTKEGSPILPARLPVASNDPSFLASIRGTPGNYYLKVQVFWEGHKDLITIFLKFWIIY